MQIAEISPWLNKWHAIYDFTPDRQAENGDPNWQISAPLNWKFIAPLKEV